MTGLTVFDIRISMRFAPKSTTSASSEGEDVRTYISDKTCEGQLKVLHEY